MGRGMDPWLDGQQAWGRLAGWYRDAPPAPPGPPDEGERALTALADIGLVRRLLDQAEFEAVRTARRQGKPWSEIAIRLGVARQSAWERWRDVDDTAAAQPVPYTSPIEDVLIETTEQVARERSGATVQVPDVVGMLLVRARGVLIRRRLFAVSPDPNEPPPDQAGWPEAVVTDQSPEAGAEVPTGTTIKLWVDRGGGSGVREPRLPKPDPKTQRKMWDEVTDEAVG